MISIPVDLFLSSHSIMILHPIANITKSCVCGRTKALSKINFGHAWTGYTTDKIDKGNNKNIVLVKFCPVLLFRFFIYCVVSTVYYKRKLHYITKVA